MRLMRLARRPLTFVTQFLRSDDPLDVRLLVLADRLLARLEPKASGQPQACCGHYGEPGC